MEFLQSRRTGRTYGKSTKRVLVHDLFGDRSSHEPSSSTTPSHVSPSPVSSDRVPQHGSHGKNAPELCDELLSSSLSDPTRGSLTRESSTIALSLKEQATKEEDLFDIRSSDESRSDGKEHKPFKKKRRVIQTVQVAGRSAAGSTSIPELHSQNMTGANKSTTNVARPPAKQEVRKLSNRMPATSTRDDATSDLRSVVTGTRKGQKTKVRQTPSQIVVSKTRSFSRPVVGDIQPVDEYISTDNSGHLSDYSSHSMASASGTPKRKRPLTKSGDEAETSPSPSQLGLTALRLTPEKPSLQRRLASPEGASDDSETPRRARPRLIDRLDAPDRNNAGIQDDHEVGDVTSHNRGTSMRASPVRGRARDTILKLSTEPQLVPASDRSQSSQSRASHPVKIRKTYAKERSHLSDMVDNLDVRNMSSSQLSDTGFVSALTSNITSVLDLEDGEGEDEHGGGALKSIHELRQAGATNRFDREVQAIFEDIEIEGSAISARLQALSKLIRRFGDASFLRYFISSQQISRLVACPFPTWDLLSVMVLAMALCALAKAETSVESLHQLLRTVDSIAPRMLQNMMPFSDLIRDQRHLLTKTVTRELASIEEFVLQSDLLIDYGKSHIVANEIVLYCLDRVLHGLHRNKVAGLSVSPATYAEILRLLQLQTNRLPNEATLLEAGSVVSNILSLLEVCSMSLERTKPKAFKNHYKDLTNCLIDLVQHAKQDHIGVMQGILRVLVSLSNNDPSACRLLGQSATIDAVFSVIDDNFLLVATNAELEHKLDEEKLNLVILALGCLLNFAECDEETRSRVASGKNARGSNIERLVAIFNSQVTKSQEVTTQEHGPVLVAFGFLSMLLCTMSLDHAIRTRITRLLEDRSFAELCSVAETFCSHMRTVESLSEEDVSPNAFNSRFAAILTSVRDS